MTRFPRSQVSPTAVRGRHQDPSPHQPQLQQRQESGRNLLQERNAAGGTTRAGGAVHLRVPVMLARETVTDRLTEELMMDTEVAELAWSVAVIIVESSEHTSTRKTTAVNSRVVVEVRLT